MTSNQEPYPLPAEYDERALPDGGAVAQSWFEFHASQVFVPGLNLPVRGSTSWVPLAVLAERATRTTRCALPVMSRPSWPQRAAFLQCDGRGTRLGLDPGPTAFRVADKGRKPGQGRRGANYVVRHGNVDVAGKSAKRAAVHAVAATPR